MQQHLQEVDPDCFAPESPPKSSWSLRDLFLRRTTTNTTPSTATTARLAAMHDSSVKPPKRPAGLRKLVDKSRWLDTILHLEDEIDENGRWEDWEDELAELLGVEGGSAVVQVRSMSLRNVPFWFAWHQKWQHHRAGSLLNLWCGQATDLKRAWASRAAAQLFTFRCSLADTHALCMCSAYMHCRPCVAPRLQWHVTSACHRLDMARC